MTIKQAQRQLDKADDALRMAGVSNLGMSAIYQKPRKHLKKLSDAVFLFWSVWSDLEYAKKRAPKVPAPERSSGPRHS